VKKTCAEYSHVLFSARNLHKKKLAQENISDM